MAVIGVLDLDRAIEAVERRTLALLTLSNARGSIPDGHHRQSGS